MKKLTTLQIAIMVIGLFIFANADVIIEQRTYMESAGLLNVEMDGTQYVKNDRSCTKGTNKMSGGIMSMVGGDKITEYMHITRLDKKVKWNIDYKSNTYNEVMLQNLSNIGQSSQPQGKPGQANQTDLTWTIEIKESNETVNINGYDCKKVTGIANGVSATDPTRKIRITYDYWYAHNVPAIDELKEFNSNYSGIAGVDKMWSDNDMGQYFSNYGDQFDKITEKMQEADGYPIKTNIVMESSTAGKGAKSDDVDYSKIPPEMKALMGLDDKPKGELNKSFSISTEVLSIEESDIDDSEFEIPMGFTKNK